jgi:hypothetical protein
MNKQQLFLIGSGRSGTTLIQRIVNTFPNTMIWGEHAGFLKQLSELYFFLKENPSMHEFSYQQEVDIKSKFDLSMYNDSKIWQAWINWFRPEDLDEMFRNIVESFFCPESFGDLKLWGFKEIRYSVDDRVFPFLNELYPDACFLFITRDSLNTIESQITTFYKGKSKFTKLKRLFKIFQLMKISKQWKVQNDYYNSLAKENPERYIAIKYEDALEDLTILNPVLSKYGHSIGQDQLDVLSMRDGRGTSFQLNSNVHSRWMIMGFLPAFLAEVIVGATSQELGYERPEQLKLATRISKWFYEKQG